MSCYVQLHRNRGIIARLIRWQQRGPHSHASIVVRGTVYEAKEFVGVIASPAAKYEADLKAGLIDVAALKLFDAELDQLEAWLQSQLGCKYDYWGVLRFVTRTKARGGGEARRWFCSEYIDAALAQLNVRLFANTESWEVSPSWLGRSVRLNFRGLSLK